MRLSKILSISLILIAQLICAQQVFAKSSVWIVSKGDDYFYLGGTFHILSPDDHPLPEEFMEAYEDAQEVIFETDIAAMKTSQVQQEMLAEMMLPPGQQLKDQLKPKTYTRLASFMKERGMPIEAFAGFKPWAVTLVITLQEYAAMGMVEEYGIEVVLSKKSNADNKTLQSLETPQQQIKFLTSLGDVDPDVSVNYTLDDLHNAQAYIKELKEAWKTGNLEMLENSTAMVELKEEFPSVHEILLVTRNNNWMNELVTLFDDNAVEVVFVGAMHLVGDSGLITQLRAEGFGVQQLD